MTQFLHHIVFNYSYFNSFLYSVPLLSYLFKFFILSVPLTLNAAVDTKKDAMLFRNRFSVISCISFSVLFCKFSLLLPHSNFMRESSLPNKELWFLLFLGWHSLCSECSYVISYFVIWTIKSSPADLLLLRVFSFCLFFFTQTRIITGFCKSLWKHGCVSSSQSFLPSYQSYQIFVWSESFLVLMVW